METVKRTVFGNVDLTILGHSNRTDNIKINRSFQILKNFLKLNHTISFLLISVILFYVIVEMKKTSFQEPNITSVGCDQRHFGKYGVYFIFSRNWTILLQFSEFQKLYKNILDITIDHYGLFLSN